MEYYYDKDNKEIKKGHFATIAISKITGHKNIVTFEYDNDDECVYAYIGHRRYTEAGLSSSPYDFE